MRPRCRGSSADGFCAAVDGSVDFAAACLPVGIAVRRNIRSAQIIGVASPKPGTGTFHLTCSLSLQLAGGSDKGATPVPSGPRHCGQNCSDFESPAETTE